MRRVWVAQRAPPEGAVLRWPAAVTGPAPTPQGRLGSWLVLRAETRARPAWPLSLGVIEHGALWSWEPLVLVLDHGLFSPGQHQMMTHDDTRQSSLLMRVPCGCDSR